MQEWLRRRTVLEESGISVPRLYAVGSATLIEEYIPFSLKDAFNAGNQSQKKNIAGSLLQTYKELATLGFRPRLMNDLRSRGDDVVLVDFGEDLGGRSDTVAPSPFSEETILNSIIGKAR